MGLKTRRNGGERVGQQVDEQQVYRRKGSGESRDGVEHYCDDACKVARKQEEYRLLDVVVKVSAVLDRLDDGGEVVVGKHHSRRILGDLGAGDSHSHADVRLLECGSVVHAVTRHGDDVVSGLPCLDYAYLVLGSNSRIYALVLDEVHELLVGVTVQRRALDSLIEVLEYAYLLGDGRSGDEVVARNHYRFYARALALGNSLSRFLARGVHHGDKTHVFKVVLVLEGEGVAVKFLAGEAEYAESFLRHMLHLMVDVVLFRFSDVHALDKNICRTLGVHYILTVHHVQGGH